MPEVAPPFEAGIVTDIPDNLATVIGKVIVAYARLEHKLTALSAVILQLHRSEVRVAFRMPRAVERLDMALDLLALKDIHPKTDIAALRETVTAAASARDILSHGIWLRHPETGQLYVQITRGRWPKDLSLGETVSRAIFPQSLPYGPDDCTRALQLCLRGLEGADELGAEIDEAMLAFPDRFRKPLRPLNPLGGRKSPSKKRPPGS